MDLLKAEIERKKRQIESSSVLPPDKKYFKRGDLAAKQEEEYWKKRSQALGQVDIISSDADTSSQHSSNSNDGHPPPVVSGSSASFSTKLHPAEASDAAREKASLSKKEVIRRLRERNEPIVLFGETEYETYLRLKKLELLEPEVNKGLKNDFKAAMDKVDQQYLNEIVGGEGSKKASVNVKVYTSGISESNMAEMLDSLAQGDTNKQQEVILQFSKFILELWGNELNARPDEDKRAMKGKMESATHTQTVEYMKPLLRILKNKITEPEILICLVDIVKYLLQRDYLRANEAYMEMAIGNAPWPIGVTMVGIHARTGREKIFAKNVAHVLNDENQRKYIQAFKRLMTKCQKYFPTDPSRMVNFEKPKESEGRVV